MKILVTGGAGFIGSHVVDVYVAAGHEVVVVDNLTTGRRENVDPAARLVEADVRDPGLADVFRRERPQVVNHHAAQGSVPVSVKDPVYDAEENVVGLINVLQSCVAAGVEKVIAISSAAVYGEPQYLPVDEPHPQRPQSPYAISKSVGERYVAFFGQQYGLRHTILRYANVYGPRQDPFGEAGVIAIFCQKVLDGERPEIHWDGEQQRDFIYVGDCARANLWALDGGDGQVFNVSTGQPTTINALFAHLCRAAGTTIEPRHGPKRPGDIRTSFLDSSRLRALGWQPEVELGDGLARTLRHFRKRSG